VFKPKTLTKKQALWRTYCLCSCHWGEENSHGITYEEGLELAKEKKG